MDGIRLGRAERASSDGGSVERVYNPSDSAPRGWYRIGHLASAESLEVGSIVLATIPGEAAALAAQRGYVREHVVRIDGTAVAIVQTADGLQRPPPVWRQCGVFADDELLLLGVTHPASFDSRYFDPIERSAVLGVARALWAWGEP